MKPAFRELAKLKGWTFKMINVQTCKSKICDKIEYVPTVYVGRKKLDLSEMEKLLND